MTTWTRHVDAYVHGVTPFTSVVGWARTLIAIGTAVTLIFTPTDQLFFRSANYPDGVTCATDPSSVSFFCLTADGGVPEWSRWVAVVVLLVVASGLLPRWTAIPHWYVTWSLATASPIPDGGDHLASNLTLVLIPLCLADHRMTHWRGDGSYTLRSPWTKYIAYGVLLLWVLQLFGVYFQASIAKMSVVEWADGSALWYWIQNPTFGPPEPLNSLVLAVLQFPVATVALTYGTLILQLAIAFGPLAPQRVRALLLLLAVAFHLGIAVLMGLWSFSLIMIGGDILLLCRPTEEPHRTLRRARIWQRVRGEPEALAVS